MARVFLDVYKRQRLDLSQAKHLKSIGAQAFYAYGSLYSEMEACTLTFPNGLESVGETAFTFQSALTGSLTFPDSVGTIGDNSFRGCGFNGALKLPENSSFQKLGSQVFMECHFTGTLRIPESVTEIADFHAFEGNQFSEVIPVSYTHLDVYKRQDFPGPRKTSIHPHPTLLPPGNGSPV